MSEKILREGSFCDFEVGITNLRFPRGGGTLMAYHNFNAAMSMESGPDARLQKRNENIKSAAETAGLPLEDLQKLKVEREEENGATVVKSIEGKINGLDVKIVNHTLNGYYIGAEVSIDGEPLAGEEGKRVYRALTSYVDKDHAANIEHVDAIFQQATNENLAHDQEKEGEKGKAAVSRLFRPRNEG